MTINYMRVYRRLEQLLSFFKSRPRWCLCGDAITKRFSLRCDFCLWWKAEGYERARWREQWPNGYWEVLSFWLLAALFARFPFLGSLNDFCGWLTHDAVLLMHFAIIHPQLISLKIAHEKVGYPESRPECVPRPNIGESRYHRGVACGEGISVHTKCICRRL